MEEKNGAAGESREVTAEKSVEAAPGGTSETLVETARVTTARRVRRPNTRILVVVALFALAAAALLFWRLGRGGGGGGGRVVTAPRNVTFDRPGAAPPQGVGAGAQPGEATLTVTPDVAARASEIYRVGVRGQAGQNLAVIRQTYELGSKTLLDYIAEQRRYIELENDYVDAILATYLARVRVAGASASPALTKSEARP